MAIVASRATAFVSLLAGFPTMPGVFNPWRDFDPAIDIGVRSPRIRAANLTAYLDERLSSARLILIGEAPGYRGCHVCGIPWTSERLLLGYGRPEIDPDVIFHGEKIRATRLDAPLGGNQGPPALSATTAWKVLLSAKQDPRSFVFWNAFPFHPHRSDALHSNRAPTSSELLNTRGVLKAARDLFPPSAKVVAVGSVAQHALERLDVKAEAVRHPSHGGALRFREQVVKLLEVL